MGDSDDEYDRRRSTRDKFIRERGQSERDANTSSSSSSRHHHVSSSSSSTIRREGKTSSHKHSEHRRSEYADRPSTGHLHKSSSKRPHERYDEGVYDKRQRTWWTDDDNNGSYNNYYQHDVREDYEMESPGKHSKPKPYMEHSNGYYDPSMYPYMPHPQQPPPPPYYSRQLDYGMMQAPPQSHYSQHTTATAGQTQPQMFSLQQFLQSINQQLTQEQATKRYNEYKNNFRKQQIQIFFETHKNEEWFRVRYHPVESVKRKTEQRNAIKRRLGIFMNLYDNGFFDGLVLNMDAEAELHRQMDILTVKLEDGNETDLEILNQIYAKKNKPRKTTLKETKKMKEKHNSDTEDGESDRESGMCSENSDVEEDEEASRTNGVQLEMPKKTKSVFFKNLHVDISRDDLEQICKRFDGYRRCAVSEPAPDRGFQKRAWLTFDSSVDIKGICAKLNEQKVRGMGLNCGVNREIEQKLRKIDALSNHKQILRNDLKLITKIITNWDKRWSLWQHEANAPVGVMHDDKSENGGGDGDGNTSSEDDDEEKMEQAESIVEEVKGTNGNELKANRLLVDVEELIVDEENAEEEELLQANGDRRNSLKFETDENLAKKLDILILYLRIVHSIDYYNSTEYQQEDWMPNRCGVLHIRSSITEVRKDVKKTDIDAYTRQFEQTVKSFVDYRDVIDLEIAKRFGLKSYEESEEALVKKNSIELDKGKWQCKLCKKKFKGDSYVGKHIRIRHKKNLGDLRRSVEFFNAFVFDPKRPYLPEHPLTRLNNGNFQYQPQMPFYSRPNDYVPYAPHAHYGYRQPYYPPQPHMFRPPMQQPPYIGYRPSFRKF